VLVTHSQEDLGAYYGRSLPELRALAEVVTNPHTRNFTPTELVDAAKGCDVVVSHRGTPFPEHVLAGLSDVMAVCRCTRDIAPDRPVRARDVRWRAGRWVGGRLGAGATLLALSLQLKDASEITRLR
jgi:hypothetical protein